MCVRERERERGRERERERERISGGLGGYRDGEVPRPPFPGRRLVHVPPRDVQHVPSAHLPRPTRRARGIGRGEGVDAWGRRGGWSVERG